MSNLNANNAPNGAGNDISLAQAAIMLSTIAYVPDDGGSIEDALQQYMPDWQVAWQPDSSASDDDNYAFIASKGNQYVLAIRGSVPELSAVGFQNWFEEDFNILSQAAWPYSDGTSDNPMVSAGTMDALNDLNALAGANNDSIFDYLNANLSASDNLCITGHSLGGGMAPVYALYLNYTYGNSADKPAVMNVITFAGPTVSNADFATQFNGAFGNSFEPYVNPLDIVPMSANNISNIGNLYFGSDDSYDPMASEIGYLGATLQVAFDGIADLLSGTEWWDSSYYTSLAPQVTLPNSQVIQNDYTGIMAWFEQAASQHATATYLSLMNCPPFPSVISDVENFGKTSSPSSIV